MKILHIEDSVHDAELVSHLLGEEWNDLAIDVVASEPTFMRVWAALPTIWSSAITRLAPSPGSMR